MMRILWLLGSLVCFFGAGVLVALPRVPAWRSSLSDVYPVQISPDGTRLVARSSPRPAASERKYYEIDTATGALLETWTQHASGIPWDSLCFLDGIGFTSIISELAPATSPKKLPNEYELRLVDAKSQHLLYSCRFSMPLQQPLVSDFVGVGKHLAVNIRDFVRQRHIPSPPPPKNAKSPLKYPVFRCRGEVSCVGSGRVVERRVE